MMVMNIFIFIGIAAAGVSGALIGIKKELDIFGVICLAILTSLGGGIIRDVLLGHFPPVSFVEPSYFLASTLAALFTCLFYKQTDKLKTIIMLFDAIGLGVFTAIGANSAMIAGMKEPFIILSMGLITGIGGGVLRDICSKEIPFVFRKEIYALAAIFGALSFLFTYPYVSVTGAQYICLAVTFLVRVITVFFNLNFFVVNTGSTKTERVRLKTKKETV